MKRLLAIATVAGLGVAGNAALAAGTLANTTIGNRATVGYTVGGAAQTPIESSPTGNSAAGVGLGVDTNFLVDDKVDLTVTRLNAAATTVTPGQTDIVVSFRVDNTGNAPHAYALLAENVGGTVFGNADSTDIANIRVYADSNANGTFEAADVTAALSNINSLGPDLNRIVFVVVDAPLTLLNGQYANVRLTASTAVNNTPGTLVAQTAGAENPAAVDVVFADAADANGNVARDGAGFALDQYAVQSAALSVTKASAVLSDPFNGTTNPKAIPGAVVEYTITVANTGGAAATSVQVTDPVPANTTFQVNVYNAAADDVRITQNGTDSFCNAEAGGTDTNADGCVRTAGGALQVGGAALPNLAPTGPNSSVTVRFQVAIQ